MNDTKPNRQQRRAAERADRKPVTDTPDAAPTFGQTWDACPFRSLLGRGGGDPDAGEMMSRVGASIAVMGGDPFPLEPDILSNVLDVIRGGKVVLLLSDRRDLRDYAKREIMSLLGPAAGHA